MTTQVQSLLAALDGRGGHIKSSIPSFHTNSPPPPLFHHPFAHLTTILHNVARKTHSAQKLILKLLTLYLTELVAMGGSVIRNEPATTALLEHYPAAYQIFQQAGWLSYFQRLQWYNEQQVLQFALNLQEDHSVVEGV
jgi:hypothetical protein